jgi:hypothetical protein
MTNAAKEREPDIANVKHRTSHCISHPKKASANKHNDIDPTFFPTRRSTLLVALVHENVGAAGHHVAARQRAHILIVTLVPF